MIPLLRRIILLCSILFILSCSVSREVAPPPLMVWPLPPEPPRITYVKTIREPRDIGIRPSFFKKVLNFLFGSGLKPQIIRPTGVAVDGENRLYVADTGLQVVHSFDFSSQEYQQIFWLTPTGPERLQNPVGVAVDGANRLYVADSALNRIYVFDKEGTLLNTIGNDEEIERVSGIAINVDQGILYAVDTPSHRIILYDLSGKKTGVIGKRGTGPAEFNFPTFIAINQEGNIYVSDSLNFRIQIFNSDGKFLHAFGKVGNTLGTFSRPKGIAIDGENHIYVVDSLYDTVQIFNEKGALLLHFGRSGGKEGEFWLPMGIAINQNAEIFVADSYNHRVQVFQFKGEESSESRLP